MPQQTTRLYANAYNALSLTENYAIVRSRWRLWPISTVSSPMHPVCILDLFSKPRRQQPDTLRATMCVKSVGNILIAHL